MKASKYYLDRVTAIYPGSFLHFRNVLSHPRWEDYDYEMVEGKDTFFFMANGLTKEDMAMKENFAPYMDLKTEYPELKEFFSGKVSAEAHTTQKVERNGTAEKPGRVSVVETDVDKNTPEQG
jgi:hypothetical protein